MALSDAAKSEIDRLIRTASGNKRGATAGDYAAWGATQSDGRSYYDNAKGSKASWDSSGIADEIYASPEFAPQSGYDPTKIAMHQDGNAKRTALALDYKGLAPQGQIDLGGVLNQSSADIARGNQTAGTPTSTSVNPATGATENTYTPTFNRDRLRTAQTLYDGFAANPGSVFESTAPNAGTAVTFDQLTGLYQNLLGRDPGEAAQSWLDSGMTVEQIQSGILRSDEYKNRVNAQRGLDITPPEYTNSNSNVQSNVADVVRADGPLMDLARTSAYQAANSRGMLNSSMAQRAAQDAVLNVALPIGSQQAGQNFESNENFRNYGYSDSLQDQSIASTERRQQEDIRFQSAEASLDRALQEQLATWNLNATESDNSARQVYYAQSAYETALANINANTNLSAEDRETQVGLARDRFDDAMQLVEQIYNIDLTWGDVAQDAEQAAA